jgi:hypothetical protein
MIEIKDLDESDIGKWVVYGGFTGSFNERGKIKSWNSSFIFVVYKCDNNWNNFQNYTAEATDPDELNFIRDAK